MCASLFYFLPRERERPPYTLSLLLVVVVELVSERKSGPWINSRGKKKEKILFSFYKEQNRVGGWFKFGRRSLFPPPGPVPQRETKTTKWPNPVTLFPFCVVLFYLKGTNKAVFGWVTLRPNGILTGHGFQWWAMARCYTMMKWVAQPISLCRVLLYTLVYLPSNTGLECLFFEPGALVLPWLVRTNESWTRISLPQQTFQMASRIDESPALGGSNGTNHRYLLGKKLHKVRPTIQSPFTRP